MFSSTLHFMSSKHKFTDKSTNSAPQFQGKDIPCPIVFVGMMGCGKTTISRGVAQYLGVRAVDLDAEIEQAANASVTEIFENYGEDHFRDGERKVMKRLLETPDVNIIATGGGAYVDCTTRAMINQKSIAVWLRADLKTIWDRVQKRDTRPLLKRPDAKEFLEKLLAERTALYEQAHLIIDVDNQSKTDTVRKVIEHVNDYIQAHQNTPEFKHKLK